MRRPRPLRDPRSWIRSEAGTVNRVGKRKEERGVVSPTGFQHQRVRKQPEPGKRRLTVGGSVAWAPSCGSCAPVPPCCSSELPPTPHTQGPRRLVGPPPPATCKDPGGGPGCVPPGCCLSTTATPPHPAPFPLHGEHGKGATSQPSCRSFSSAPAWEEPIHEAQFPRSQEFSF